MNLTILLRASLAVLGCAAIYNLRHIDTVLAYVWAEVIYPSEIFHHDSFEVLLSSLLFAIYTFSWVILDFYVPAAHIYRISDTSASNLSWKGRENALFQETMWYSLPWMLLDLLVPRRHLLLSHFSSPPTFYRIIQDIFLSLVLYDFLFYVGHLMMHRNRYLYRTVHSKHHTMGSNIKAGDAIRHTFLDGFFDVICSVISLKVTRAHPFSRSLFNIIAIFLISEAHSGYDFPWSAHNLLTVVAGPVTHKKHHQKGTCNFAKFFVWCDIIGGTYSTSK